MRIQRRAAQAIRTLLTTWVVFGGLAASANTVVCNTHQGVALQILGSGGPELTDGRASSGYLIWVSGEAKLLVDLGPGTAANFEKANARMTTLVGVLFSHFHVDHSSDLPAITKGAYFTTRNEDLPLLGPTGNDYLPNAENFVALLFGDSGAFPYLSDVMPGGNGKFSLVPTTVITTDNHPASFQLAPNITVTAISTHHGPINALAWRVDVEGKAIVFTGDTTNQGHTVERLGGAPIDILVAHNAIPEQAAGVATQLHMKPSAIAALAKELKPRVLVLSHFMTRSLGATQETQRIIEMQYQGPIEKAEDMACYPIN